MAYDQRLKWADKELPHPGIVLIGRDLESERQLGHGIWDRAVFAKMIQALGEAGASVVALDFAFIGPSPADRGGKASDELLIHAIENMGHVVLPLPVQRGQVSPAVQIGSEQPRLDHFIDTLAPSLNPIASKSFEKASLLGPILPGFFESAQHWGHIAAVSDNDGVFRRIPAFLQVENHAVPAFGVAIAASYLNITAEDLSVDPQNRIIFRKAIHANGENSDLLIPIDEHNQFLMNYVGEWDKAPFPYLLFSDVLEAITEEKLHELRHWVEGKIVLIFHAGAEHDRRRTPLELNAPGGFIHANVIQTILTRSFLTPSGIWTQLFILFFLTISTVSCVIYLPWKSGWMGILLVSGGYFFLTQLSFSSSGRIYPTVLPLMGVMVSAGLAYAWTLWNEKQQVQNLENTVEQYQQDLRRAQENLARAESLVEQVQEDLEANRTETLSEKINQEQKFQKILEFEEKLQNTESELETSRNEVSRLKKDLEASRAQLVTVQAHQVETSTLQEMEHSLHEAEMRLQMAQSEKAQLEDRLDQSRRKLVVAKAKQEEASQVAKQLETKLQTAESNLLASRTELVHLKSSISSPQSAVSAPISLSDLEFEQLRQECETCNIITSDTRLLAQFKDLKKVAQTQMPVLILGEPGTGKELFAKAVHTLSPRHMKNFVPTNMAAIPETLFESQWFGHHKGAFTGAQDHKGFFEQADQGTIFLDEIGDLQMDMQAKLLRVLENKVITPLGSTRSKTIDVRVVAATNKDLLRGVQDGWFRRDLYDRILGFTLILPPLRERTNDLELLAQQIVQQASREMGRENLQISEGAMETIKRGFWPGNIRELQKSLQKTVALVEGNLIRPEDIRMEAQPQPQGQTDFTKPEVVQDISGDHALLLCLRQNDFDMQRTAKIVGWERSTVTQRLKGLCFQALVEHDFDRSKAAKALAQGDPVTVRLIELKLNGYYDHLLKLIAGCRSAEEAIPLCRQRLKNFPDRHLPSMDALIRHNFKN